MVFSGLKSTNIWDHRIGVFRIFDGIIDCAQVDQLTFFKVTSVALKQHLCVNHLGNRISPSSGGHVSCLNYSDLTVLPNPGIMVGKGNDPNLAILQVSEIWLN